MSSEFLLEVGCEEIPARAMGPVLEELKKKFGALLGGQKLSFDAIQTLGSARRLVVHVAGLAELQEKEKVTTLGPPQKIAFNDGEPSRALIGFARKSGLGIDDLRVFDTERGKYMGFESEAGGRSASEILAEGIPPLIESLTFPKTMYWDDSRREFARPIRWVVALLGPSVVPFNLYGVPSGSTSAGHRTLGSQTVPVRDFDNYLKQLADNFVLVSQESRREKIRRELAAACESLDGRMIPDDDLLDEVVYINEYPTVVVGGFEKRFLDLPREVLITAMREHQKYFAVETADGTLLPNFLGVMNTKGDPRGSIRKGHERVLKARLSDALFFWDADGRRTLADRVDGLASVTFHRKLGSYKDKIDRMSGLANAVNALTGAAVPPETLESVVAWSKSDLSTDLVGEFAGLQGIAGGLYARREGAGDDVWKAIYDQYRPAGLDDHSPETASGAVLALTDRLDTVFGCFSAGLIPKGSADPLALRRQTQGIVKILLDRELPFSLDAAIAADPRMNETAAELFRGFYRDRLKFMLGRMGFAYDEVNAVVATDSDSPTKVLKRVRALHAVRESPDLIAIATAFKRIKNILKQADVPLDAVDGFKDMELEEEALARSVAELRPRIEGLAASGDYSAALGEMAALRPVVDGFFDKILVMHRDHAIRARRLSILKNLFETFLQVADISEVVVANQDPPASTGV